MGLIWEEEGRAWGAGAGRGAWGTDGGRWRGVRPVGQLLPKKLPPREAPGDPLPRACEAEILVENPNL